VVLRVLNLVVIGVLVLAAGYVYRIKFDATIQAERLARLRGELRHERDRIAALRAEWEQLDSPARIETLVKRYLPMRPIAPTQFDTLDRLPEHTAEDLATRADPIGGMIENLEQPTKLEITGSVPVAGNPNRAEVDRAAHNTAGGASSNERNR
jgi:cell division protein FtsL